MPSSPDNPPQLTPTPAPPVSQPIPAISPAPKLSSSPHLASPSDCSPLTVCCDQTSSGSSGTSIAAPCSPVSQPTAPQPTCPLAKPAPLRIRRISIDFNYRKPTPNLNPVEPTPAELLAKDFRFLTHEPRQPLYRPAVLRRSKFYPPTQPPAGSLECCYPAACLHAPLSPIPSSALDPDSSNPLSSIRNHPSRSSFIFISPTAPLRAVPHTPNTVIIENKKFGRVLTRSRWVPDIQRESCAHDNCPQRFDFFHRKHHCRSCGEVFCQSHSSQTAQLFDGGPAGEPTGKGLVTCRVCDTCAVTLSCGIDPISPRYSLRELVGSSGPPSPATRHQPLSDSMPSITSSGRASLHPRRARAGPQRKTRSQSSKGSQTAPSLPTGGTSSSSASHLTYSPPGTTAAGRNLTRPRQHSSVPGEVSEPRAMPNCMPLLNSKPYHPFPDIPVIDCASKEEERKPVTQEEVKWPDREEETEDEAQDDDDDDDDGDDDDGHNKLVEDDVIKYRPSRMFW